MQKSEVNRFNKLYQEHQSSLKLQGKAPKTIMPTQGQSGLSLKNR